MSDLSASAILAIPLDKPHLLFPGDVAGAAQAHKRLVAKWHPDRNGGQGSEVMGHINVLFERAREMISAGRWPAASVLNFHDQRGTPFRLRYLKAHEFELGRCYIAQGVVLYRIEERFTDLAANAVDVIRSLSYRDDAMKQEHARYMPQIERVVRMEGGGTAILIRKQPHQFLLADVLEHFGGAIEPKHVAWILSSLYNVNAYLKWAHIDHNAIGPSTYFLSPPQHNGALLGGWWYAAKEGRKPKAVPARTHRAGKDFTTKAIDASLIRMTGLELLGPAIKSSPPALQVWLRGMGSADSFSEYKKWADLLVRCFGPPRYAEMKLPDIYN